MPKITNHVNNRIQILDCTLRDGGLAIEDAYLNENIVDIFTTEEIKTVSEVLSESMIDIIELGSIEISDQDKKKFAIYQNIEEISTKTPHKSKDDQLVAALFRGPDTPIENIPNVKDSYVDVLRVILRYSELQKSIDFCAHLVKKGYKVFIQPMVTMRYTEEEINMLIESANEMKAYALYFVDSYGYMDKNNIENLYNIYDENLEDDIKIGFHAHNNISSAFSNACWFIEYAMNKENSSRKIVVDSCILGMGQGAGNAQTELLANYLNNKWSKSYNFPPILDACEIIEKHNNENLWGYSVTNMLPAINKTAYKYSFTLRNKYGYPYRRIYEILRSMPEDLRHRYTLKNTKNLINLYNSGKLTGDNDK
ncbi:MAG: hypothetical protein LBE72_01070 [Rickettsia sp.]|nr:hypothetical protein [Rickettsia sp.]